MDEVQGTSTTRINTRFSEEEPLTEILANQRDEILTGIQIREFERRDKMSTKVIDETTPEFISQRLPTLMHLHEANPLLLQFQKSRTQQNIQKTKKLLIYTRFFL